MDFITKPTTPRPPGFIDSSSITIEVPNDPHIIHALEVVCFDRKFKYKRLHPLELIKPPTPGNIVYQIDHTDPVQLFWLGAAFQSLLNQSSI